MEEMMGTIKLFAGTFAPRGFMYCAGQLLPISQYTALFSILGTTYGGDGRTTFALPDLKSRVPVGAGMGQANGLSDIRSGQIGGQENHTLLSNEMPSHNHGLNVSNADAGQSAATAGATIATPGSSDGRSFTATNGFNTATPNTALNPHSMSVTGGGQPHNNMQPYVGLIYIICVEGIYPSRS